MYYLIESQALGADAFLSQFASMDTPLPLPEPGTVVELHGLEARPELNGAKAMVLPNLPENTENGRVRLQLVEGAQEVSIKLENLRSPWANPCIMNDLSSGRPGAVWPLHVIFRDNNVMHWPFNNDLAVEREVARLIRLFNVKCIVETGTFLGATTECFMRLPDIEEVYTIEANAETHAFVQKRLAPIKRIQCLFGDSVDVLKNSLAGQIATKHCVPLFYLDAHWNDYWPLHDEIKIIGEHMPDRAIIVIDDFQVPNRSFRFDSYRGQPNNFESVEAVLNSAYPGGFVHYYNNVSLAHAPIGKLYVLPAKQIKDNCFDRQDFVVDDQGIPYAKGDEIFK